MKIRMGLLAGAACCAFAFASPANAMGIKIGVLTCHVDGGWGYVLGSSKDVHCNYHPGHGRDDYYRGSISKFGVDIGYTRSATIIWDVVAPTSDLRPGALAGDYAGVTASATVAIGVGAHALLGGFDRSIALQPISVEGNSGLDIAAGIGEMSLRRDPSRYEVAGYEETRTVEERVRWNPDRDFVTYFNFNSAALTPAGRGVVRNAARRAERMDARRILVTGHTDTVGSESYNDSLSEARADAVRSELIRDGVNQNVVYTAGRGFDDPQVPTPPDVREGRNRRAVIDIRSVREDTAER
ncbi:MAG TPA: DUF992 domain-containing protein [Rhizomicrobium sp.]|jgi:outer membrane protein OmpA-like peptidoglycan-associated protein